MKRVLKAGGFKQLLLLGAVGFVTLWTAGSSAGTTAQGGWLIRYYSGPDYAVVTGQRYVQYAPCPAGVATPASWGDATKYSKEMAYNCSTLQPMQR
ncbi:hypothetical protein [Luteimonas panaciterrae]|uniref:hypothetical protein n=1 Tax=Luteimonas panaciterrae TaxID=363885 RepID=UPI001CFC02D1|nr:hypothetical protein [Luteimonas panaciterrae]